MNTHLSTYLGLPEALVSSKAIIELYWDGEVEIKEKQREMGIKYLPPT
jgi:hypothetical protein